MRFLLGFAPGGIVFEGLQLSFVGKGKAAGVEHGSGDLIPGAILVVAYQGEAPAGELDSDLVTASGMEPDVDQSGFSFCQSLEFQPGGLNTLAHPLDHEHLVFAAVFPQ